MIRVCTVSDAEISDRTAHGEYDIDVADEHTSYIWFFDRESFDLAWKFARLIAKGAVFPSLLALKAGHVCELTFGSCIVVWPSPHHLQPCEAA